MLFYTGLQFSGLFWRSFVPNLFKINTSLPLTYANNPLLPICLLCHSIAVPHTHTRCPPGKLELHLPAFLAQSPLLSWLGRMPNSGSKWKLLNLPLGLAGRAEKALGDGKSAGHLSLFSVLATLVQFLQVWRLCIFLVSLFKSCAGFFPGREANDGRSFSHPQDIILWPSSHYIPSVMRLHLCLLYWYSSTFNDNWNRTFFYQ